MITWGVILVLFWLGLRLSFFFSGIETAFYRVSKMRLNIDAQTGDQASRHILRFVTNPSLFVATILIGNNLANYLTTYAISSAAIHGLGEISDLVEVGVTILFAPIVFVFGELLPKTLHYLAPLRMLKRYFTAFRLAHACLLPLSWPLILFTGLLRKLGGVQQEPMMKILGRRPLANVIGQGHEEGVVTQVQHDLIQGVFLNASLKLDSLVTPREVAFFQMSQPTRAQLLEQARAYGLVEVSLLNEESDAPPRGEYFRVCDLLLQPQAALQEIRRTMLPISPKTTRLEALLQLQAHDCDVGLVVEGNLVRGIIRRRVLVETLMQGGLTSQPGLT